jgi:hypothetical protein
MGSKITKNLDQIKETEIDKGYLSSKKSTNTSSKFLNTKNILISPKNNTRSVSNNFSIDDIKRINKKKLEGPLINNKNKQYIDAATELDVLKIVRKNNYTFEDYDLIENCLLKHFFMRPLEKEARNEIIKEMSLCKVDADTYIFRQDSIGNFFYIIKEGECELYVNENHIKNLNAGENFGELALLHGAPRSGSIKTIGITYLWCLERRNFRKIVDHINFLNYEENKKFIENVPIFSNIEKEYKCILASNLMKEYYEKDKFIVKGKLKLI